MTNLAAAEFDSTILAIALGAFLVAGPLIFLGVLWIISRCGWQKFSAGRECPVPPPGESVNVVTVVFGNFARYNNATVATFTPEGFHLRARWIVKVFHPAFFVPWELVASCQKRPFFRRVLPEFYIACGTSILYLRLSEANYQRVEPLLPERLRGALDRDPTR